MYVNDSISIKVVIDVKSHSLQWSWVVDVKLILVHLCHVGWRVRLKQDAVITPFSSLDSHCLVSR